ncbi:Phosphoenolpyruvate carboxylase [Candidatus Bilamarchaeum dharawalense]|uniref:Phosphoenolpyruvate carboxylase n=1 Tax=Candidatus Bilamarchaeum dharawalense TaxID=2885759 RepID=A0A5E4LSX0_9ARCH|nr:Phosphoenolpyruvate carboxylase [Candidatus Bilamarchaeum dharawalense]
MRTIPRCMSTQHPDNVTTPFFSDSDVLAGEAEVKEAFFVFSQLGCQEQMWDSEGKEADNQVVEKLLSRYLDFFTKQKLGKDFFLTYRVPNPSIEKNQGKILLETLHSIPRAFDVAKAAGLDISPIFEVILPMTTSHLEVKRVKNYYEQIIIGQKETKLGSEKISVKDWVGDFQPETINVIPLMENFDSLLNCDSIVSKYLEGKDYEYQRVFLARSDPALNYGSASAVLLSKIALQKLQKVEEETSTPIMPIIGVGGAPFRGNFNPHNVNNCGDEYPSVQTFTAQSSFKYDHPFREVVNAVDMINHAHRRPPLPIDEKRALELMKKMVKTYESQLKEMADLINGISVFVPGRRARKLHVGLFGYSRSMKGIKMPRAIKFCASFYSLGIPPELLGLSALNDKEFDELHEHYTKIDEDLKDGVKYLNPSNLDKMPTWVKKGVSKVLEWIDFEPDEDYCTISTRVLENYLAGRHTHIGEDIKALAWKRSFLG